MARTPAPKRFTDLAVAHGEVTVAPARKAAGKVVKTGAAKAVRTSAASPNTSPLGATRDAALKKPPARRPR